MDIQTIEFSSFAIYYFFFLAVVIYLIFRAVNKLWMILPLSRENQRRFFRFMPMLELLGWVVFFVWGIQFFAKNNHLYSLGLFVILMIVLIWFSWSGFKNFIARSFFQINNRFKINEIIKIGNYRGKIISFGAANLELESETGEHIYIPYFKLQDEIIIKSDPAEMIKAFVFKLKSPDKQTIADTSAQLHKEIINLPWTSINKAPQIIFREKQEDQYLFEITVYALEADSFFKIREEMERNYTLI